MTLYEEVSLCTLVKRFFLAPPGGAIDCQVAYHELCDLQGTYLCDLLEKNVYREKYHFLH